MKEIVLKSIPIYKGKIVDLRRNLVKLPNDKLAFREIVNHQKGVCVIPLLNNEILFIKQYRSGCDRILLELPAGLVDENEKSIDAAIRELAEETGYSSAKITYLGEYYSSPGFTNEAVSIYLCEDLFKKELPKDEDEFLELVSYSVNDAIKLLNSNMILDMKTALALSLYFNKNCKQ